MILYLNACVRRESRTKRLAEHVLRQMGEPYTELRLGERIFAPTDEVYLQRRDRLVAERRFEDPMFDLARQFAAAERIVIAAPYWDLSFPAALKQYIEQINVPGLTFFYTPEGVPQGLCRAKELVYVSTAGGGFVPNDFGFGYIRALAQGFYGIAEVRLVQAVGLDLDGADPEAILAGQMKDGKDGHSMNLYHGSPAELSGRSEREKRCYAFLDALGVSFERTDHPEQPATTMEVCAVVDAVLGVHICKNLFLCNRQQTAFYLLIMPGDKPFKTKELSGQMGVSRLSFANEEHMARLLDVRPGSVSVLALMNDPEHRVKLVIDEDVLREPLFGCHPCENTSSIRFATRDLTEHILPALGIEPILVKLVGTE